MHSTEVAIEVSGLAKRYGERTVLDGAAFRVARGECVALLGPNGAGKTTTVEILEGFRRRDGGTVSVCGEDPIDAGPAWRTRIGIVPQNGRPQGELTVAEVVTEYATYYPNPRPPAEVIEAVGLTGSAGQRVKRLSGGQQRRLDVALGLVGRPEVLFLDEPTTGFDPEARRQFWELIKALRDGGTTILLTTHYLDEAAVLADRVVVLAGGRVVADTTAAQLGDRHLAPCVVRWSEDGQRRESVTPTPTALVGELAARLGGEIPDLSIERRSLEDAYLELIGAQP